MAYVTIFLLLFLPFFSSRDIIFSRGLVLEEMQPLISLQVRIKYRRSIKHDYIPRVICCR